MTVDEAVVFIAGAEWVFAKTYAKTAPHEYTTLWSCRARGLGREFVAFARLIEDDGYWRDWGGRRWRSLNVGDRFYWLYWEHYEPEDRTIINRWTLAPQAQAPAQLSFEVTP
jgi:hypothetical protein